MTRAQLAELHMQLTETRTLAHEAYTTALANRTKDGDTEAAYQTLLKVNHVRDRVYAAMLALV